MIVYEGVAFGCGIACGRLVPFPASTDIATDSESLIGPDPILAYCPELPPLDRLVGFIADSRVVGILLPELSPFSHHAWALSYHAKPAIVIKNFPQGHLNTFVCVDFSRHVALIPENAAEKDELSIVFACRATKGLVEPLVASDNATTRGGRRIALLSQIQDVNDVALALDQGANGVGEIKTELTANRFPTSKSHDRAVSQICLQIRSLTSWSPIPVRFFDFTNDKVEKDGQGPLGYRGVRLLEITPSLFDRFIALLEGLRPADIVIVLPMVSHMAEIERFRQRLPTPDFSLGVQIETPAAALMIREILSITSYLVIGLNDLTQYTVAWDRNVSNSERLSSTLLHPAVARLIGNICSEANAARAHISLALDLYPTSSLVDQIIEIGVPALTVSPRLISLWRSYINAAN